MADSNLVEIVRLLLRSPQSQTALGQKLKLSRSHVSALVKSLIEQGYAAREESLTAEGTEAGSRRRQRITLVRQDIYTAVVIHTLWEFSLAVYALGSLKPLCKVTLSHQNLAEAMGRELSTALQYALLELKIDPSKLKLMVFATQASLEQGYAGVVFRDNVLQNVNCPLAALLTAKLKLPVFVCNYAYAHLLCLLHSPFIGIDSALALLCGEGSVAMGIFVDGRIVLGPRQTFPECSHLPFPGGFENALGSYGEHTAQALLYAVEALAPIFKLQRVILAGSCFEKHPEVIAMVKAELAQNPNSLLRQTVLEYWPREIERFEEELVLLSFDELVLRLNLTPIKRSLEDLIQKDALF